MSAYTDREHYEIIEATKAWKNDPVTAQEYYLYGKLQYRLKDYYKAAVSYKAAVELGYGPAKFALAFAMFREEGIYKSSEYTVLAKEGYDYYAKLPSKTSEQFYYLAMALRYGVGCEINLKKAIAIFQQIEEQEPNALFEIGLCFEQGILEDKDAIKKAMQYYELAYEQFCEDAIFQHFKLYEGEFNKYPFQREIKEAYSFKLGQFMRIVQVSPSKDSNKRVAMMYENGYPGDNEEETKRFQEKAIPYRKAAETMEEEFIYGKMYTYVESRIYQDIICKKDMSFYDQSSFLKTCI